MSCHPPDGGYREKDAEVIFHWMPPIVLHPRRTIRRDDVVGKVELPHCGRILRWLAVVFVVISLSAVESTAAGLQKYSQWENSPEAVFMTAKEKTEWKRIRSDAKAEKFIAEYRSRRGSNFSKELQRRIEMADRYLTSGQTPGSRTLRGRVMILFGPPTRIERSGGTSVGQPENPMLSGVYTNVGPMGSRSTQVRVAPVSFTLRYSGHEVKERLGRDELVVRIEIDSTSGAERFADRAMVTEFESVAMQVAEWSIVTEQSSALRMADFH